MYMEQELAARDDRRNTNIRHVFVSQKQTLFDFMSNLVWFYDMELGRDSAKEEGEGWITDNKRFILFAFKARVRLWVRFWASVNL